MLKEIVNDFNEINIKNSLFENIDKSELVFFTKFLEEFSKMTDKEQLTVIDDITNNWNENGRKSISLFS